MKESEMQQIAEYISKIIINDENAEKIKKDILSFRNDYQKVHYAFEDLTDAYKYIKIRN